MHFPARISDFVPWLRAQPGGVMIALAVAFVLVLGLFLLLLRRRKGPPPLPPPSLEIDLEQMGDAGPPAEGTQIRCYGVKVRLAVLVLAPVGRGEHLPEEDGHRAVIDQIVPGLADVCDAHGTLLKVWPPQLSPRGFAHSFFANVELPGDRGKGTPWCSLAGKMEADGQQFMAGVALCAAKENSLSQYIIEQPGEWLDVLRVEE